MTLRLREIRKSKGVTQTFIAGKLGVSISSYNSIELEKTKLDLLKAAKIAILLNISINDLISEQELLKIAKSN